MKKMIAILLVLCLLPVTGLAFKLPDINAYSGYQLTKRDEKNTSSGYWVEYSCNGIDVYALVESYTQMMRQYRYTAFSSPETGSFKLDLIPYVTLHSSVSSIFSNSKTEYDFKNPVVLEYNDQNDTLCFSFNWNKIGINAVGDTGERFKPVESATASSTHKPSTNATSKPGKTRCNTCDGTGRVEKDCSICGGDGYKDCSECSGKGYYRCKGCDGYGNKTCPRCYGSGKDGKERCSKCGGKRTVRCGSCSSGKLTCSACNGRKEKKCTACRNGKKSSDCSRCGGTGWR